jgi:hypothetical protein
MAYKFEKRNILYANLMDEVKVRIEMISTVATGRGNFPSVITREFCYLQLRMLCELIALSCLVAHGDIAGVQSHKIGKAYSADEILKRVEKLRSHFYPSPITQGHDATTGGRTVTVVSPSPLPKEELLSLYAKTHRYLHRGSLKKMLSMDVPIDLNVNIPEIIKWAQKINDLLSLHVIAVSADHVILCMLRNADDNNRVQVVTAQPKLNPD